MFSDDVRIVITLDYFPPTFSNSYHIYHNLWKLLSAVTRIISRALSFATFEIRTTTDKIANLFKQIPPISVKY